MGKTIKKHKLWTEDRQKSVCTFICWQMKCWREIENEDKNSHSVSLADWSWPTSHCKNTERKMGGDKDSVSLKQVTCGNMIRGTCARVFAFDISSLITFQSGKLAVGRLTWGGTWYEAAIASLFYQQFQFQLCVISFVLFQNPKKTVFIPAVKLLC